MLPPGAPAGSGLSSLISLMIASVVSSRLLMLAAFCVVKPSSRVAMSSDLSCGRRLRLDRPRAAGDDDAAGLGEFLGLLVHVVDQGVDVATVFGQHRFSNRPNFFDDKIVIFHG